MRRFSTLFLSLALPAVGADALERFETDVRPLLAKHCFGCHTQTKMGGLEMSSREALLQGGANGPAVEPRAPERSLLIRAVKYEDERLRMPPAGKLDDEEIAKLVRWVDEGAVWPKGPEAPAAGAEGKYRITSDHRSYWAFQPVRKTEPPAVPGASAAIDRFLGAKLREAGLEPAPLADKRTLLCRVYFDLTGLPPAPADYDAFLADNTPDAYARVIDRLLSSPSYGERWGRIWLDVARYSDERLNSTQDEPYENAFRYRDWTIEAFNRDLPYDLFVKAQLAADHLTEAELRGVRREDLVAGLGFFALSPQFQDDRVDVLGKAFLGLTIGCAQCHDHKFDPIPTEDYYALLGVFNSSKIAEHPLAPSGDVAEWKRLDETAKKARGELDTFLATQARALVDAFAARTSDYLMAAYRMQGPEGADAARAAADAGLDAETLERWAGYLGGARNHPLLDPWNEMLARQAPETEFAAFAESFQTLLVNTIEEKKRIDKENEIRLGGDGSARKAARTELLSLARDPYFLWRDVATANGRSLPVQANTGVLYYKGETLDRFLSGPYREHVERARERAAALEAQVPPKYPFLHVLADVEKPANEHVHIRGNAENLGDEVPRRFLQVLHREQPPPFQHGSGRLDLARAIADPANPLTARVIVNRVWLGHFGRGLVAAPSNFGLMGERPTHPELLDYLAGRLVESGWSLKTLHREILLSDAYRRSARPIAANLEKDGENKLLWRFDRRRLDVEALRDATLAVAGSLDAEAGGPPAPLDSADNRRRTVYGFVSRRKIDNVLGLFDFPNPNSHSERRIPTDTPMQGLYFLNSEFLIAQAEIFAARVASEAPDDPLGRAYRLLYGREPSKPERKLAGEFLRSEAGAWPRLAQVLLSSNEFLYVD